MMKMLFVGNSFTYFNDMPSIFGEIARLDGNETEVSSVTRGGRSLLMHLESGDECSELLRAALAERPSAVILQEQSRTPLSSFDSFRYAATALVDMIREVGAEPYLYATWGYKSGHAKLPSLGSDTQDMEKKLRKAYSSLGKELGVKVCHVGAAMTYAYSESSAELYQPDCYHPSLCASVIAALTIYSTIFSKDPLKLTLPEGLVSTVDAETVRRAAHEAIFNRQE